MSLSDNPDVSYSTYFIRENNLEQSPVSVLRDKFGGFKLWVSLVPDAAGVVVAAGMEDDFRTQANELAANDQVPGANLLIEKGKAAVDAYFREQGFEPRLVAKTWKNHPNDLNVIVEDIWSGRQALIPKKPLTTKSKKFVTLDATMVTLSDEAKTLL